MLEILGVLLWIPFGAAKAYRKGLSILLLSRSKLNYLDSDPRTDTHVNEWRRAWGWKSWGLGRLGPGREGKITAGPPVSFIGAMAHTKGGRPLFQNIP